MRTFSILSILLVIGTAAVAQEVLRGPYLQMPTSNGMTVMWRTDVPVTARVYYGTSLSNVMDNFVDATVDTVNHSVRLIGLQPYTEYYYAIAAGETVLMGGEAMYRFRTSPEIGTVQPITVWSIGDFGKGNERQLNVMEGYRNFVGDDLSDIWLWLGDNAYSDGTDQEYQDHVFDEQYGMTDLMKRMPFMATPGNHDYLSISPPTVSQNPANNTGAYYDIVDVPTYGEMGGVPSGYELYYSFDYGNVHFVSLNSEIGSVLSGSNDWTGANPFSSFSGSPMTEWLHTDLAANDKPWTVVFFHQPPHSDGSHFSGDLWERYMTAMRVNICPILEQYGVDVIINGHSHVYERSYLLKGFFGTPGQFNMSNHVVSSASGSLEDGEPYIKYKNGPTANVGTVYVVQGNSGSSTSDPNFTHPAMLRTHGCSECVGSTLFYIHGDTLKGTYITSAGEVLDEFAIIKQEAPSGIVEEHASIGGLEVFPNPFNTEATVRFEALEDISTDIELVSINGQVLHTFHSGRLLKGTHQYTVNAGALNLARGTYLVRISSSSRPSVVRLIKME